MRDSFWVTIGKRFSSSASSSAQRLPTKVSLLHTHLHRGLSGRPSLTEKVPSSSLISSYIEDQSFSALLHDFGSSCREGDINNALSILEEHNLIPSQNLLWTLLQACSKHKALANVNKIHSHLIKHGGGLSNSLLDYLVSILAKCGALDEALTIFYQLPCRTIQSWSAVISAFTECGQPQQALETYRNMQDDGIQPNEYTLVSLLKACGSMFDVEEGKILHTCASMKGLDSHDFVGSSLVSMYGKCAHIAEAENVFHNLSKCNVVAWNAMLTGYIEQGEGKKALWLYENLKQDNRDPNERTFVILLQACCMLAETEAAAVVRGAWIKPKALAAGRSLEADLRTKGFQENVFVCNILVSMFGKCGCIDEAEKVFLEMSEDTVISWTAMLSAYVEHGEAERALQLYRNMQEACVSSNECTFVIVFQACCILAERKDFLRVQEENRKVVPWEVTRALHAEARRKGYDENVCVGSVLVNFYGKCGRIEEAKNAFDRLSEVDVAAWNGLLLAYVEQERGDAALQLYKLMQQEGISPDEQAYVVGLQACCILATKEEAAIVGGRSMKVVSLEIGRALHTEAQRKGFDPHGCMSSTLVSMYGKCGSIEDAESVFDGLRHHDVVAWSVLLSAYGEQGLVQEALCLYLKMHEEGVVLDDASFLSAVQACNETGALELCRRLHFDILSTQFDLSLSLTTAFVHAYGSCGSMMDSCAVFNVLLEPDVVSWSALMAGYAKEGNFALSFQTFESMKHAQIEPNEVTFLCLLSACSHVGLVNKAVDIFESMSDVHDVRPKLEHFVTIVFLLGRVGDLERAEDMLSRMPGQPDLAMWLCLLGACLKHGNLETGERVFDHALLLNPNKAAAYVIMSNMYSDAGLRAG